MFVVPKVTAIPIKWQRRVTPQGTFKQVNIRRDLPQYIPQSLNQGRNQRGSQNGRVKWWLQQWWLQQGRNQKKL